MNVVAALTEMKARDYELDGALARESRRLDTLRQARDEAQNLVAGLERAEQERDIQVRKEAEARASALQAELREAGETLQKLKDDQAAVQRKIHAASSSQPNALTLYRAALEQVAQVEAETRRIIERRDAAGQAVKKLRQDVAAATLERERALDAAVLAAAVIKLGALQAELASALQLDANLQRQQERLKAARFSARNEADRARLNLFRVRSDHLTERLRQQVGSLAFEAFAAFRLSGYDFSFNEWIGRALNPGGDYLPPAVEACQQQALADLNAPE